MKITVMGAILILAAVIAGVLVVVALNEYKGNQPLQNGTEA